MPTVDHPIRTTHLVPLTPEQSRTNPNAPERDRPPSDLFSSHPPR